MTLQQILEEVKKGQLSVEHAEDLLKKEGYEEMDYAKLDTTRKARTGFAEVVYCARKADEHLLNIYQKLYEEDGEVFGTRASEHQYELVKKVLPDVVYDPVSGILKIEKEKEHIGKVAVCTAGTADISVAEEAAQTAEYFGTHVERIYDVGVSGMHRLFSRLDTIQEANCVVAVAGMEGAGKCYGWSCETSGDRGTYFCGIWRQLSWIVSASDNDQFLCQRNCSSEY